jgi:hypothetical protein
VENMRNKRRHKRVLISGIATLEFEEKGVIQLIQAVIANISLKGIGLYSYDSIKVKTRVSITINFISINGEIKTNSVEGRVIFKKKIGKTYFIGIKFSEEINAEEQPSLFDHIKKSLTWGA